jgi:DNA polymerase/3'-5' exonuclease PolX
MSKNKIEDIITENSKNELLFLEFRKLVKIYEYLYTKIDDPKEKIMYKHKIISLKNSTKQIKIYPDEIKEGKDLAEISGIGKGTIARMDEFIKDKKLEEITNFCNQYDCDTILYNKNPNLVYEDLLTVFGIGDKMAKKLIETYKLKSIKDLQKLVKENKITLPNNVKTGLKYFGKVKNHIPRSEITQIREYIYDAFENLDPNLVFDICGSFRRKKPFSNDIDLLVTSYDLIDIDDDKSSKIMKKIINSLEDKKFIIDRLTDDISSTKFMGLCKGINMKDIRRLDIRLVPMKSFFPAYLYFTGSYEFNERMRGIAKRDGYKLNEYGLYNLKLNKQIPIYSEKDVFDVLSMKYLEPKDRI